MAIPFINNEDGYQKVIERIMEVERGRVTRLETTVEENKARLQSLNEISEQFDIISNYAHQLYGLDSVFRKNTIANGSSDFLEATAERPNLSAEPHSLQILQLAKAQTISSRPVKTSMTLKPSEFIFRFNEEKITFSFAGGTIEDFALAINREKALQEYLKVRLIRKAGEKSVLIFTSQKEGRKNRIQLVRDSGNILTSSLQVFERNTPTHLLLLSESEAIAQLQTQNKGEWLGKNKIKMAPGETLSFTVDKNFSFADMQSVDYELYRIIENTPPPIAANAATTNTENTTASAGQRIGKLLGASQSENTAEGAVAVNKNSEAPVSGPSPAPPPVSSSATIKLASISAENLSEAKKQQTIATFYYRKIMKPKNNTVALIGNGFEAPTTSTPNANASSNTISSVLQHRVTLGNVLFGKVVLDDYAFKAEEERIVLEKVTFTNVEAGPIAIGLLTATKKRKNKDGYRPAQEVVKPQNAVVSYENIEIERDSNTITNLIEGVSLNLKKPSPQPINLTPTLNEREIYERILGFFQAYNDGIELLNIVIAPDEESLRAASLSETQREKIGLFNGNYNFYRFKEAVRALITKPYATGSNKKLGEAPLRLLVQLGIERAFSIQNPFDIDNDKVTIDLNKLQGAIATHGKEIGDFFGFDSDNNVLIDSGIAYEIETSIRQFFQRGSYFSLLDERIRQENNDFAENIEEENERLAAREEQLNRDFGKVEAAMQEQESFSQYFERFNQQP